MDPAAEQRSLADTRSALHRRLLAHRREIEQAIATRVHGISNPGDTNDPEYVEGIRDSLSAALDYALDALEHGEDSVPPIPTVLLGQARLAARVQVGLDVVLRRYLSGYTLLADFLIEGAEEEGMKASTLQRLIRAYTGLFDRLLEEITQEHGRGLLDRPTSSNQRHAELVDRLLAGEPVDTAKLAYSFDGYHLGVISSGPGAVEAIDAIAAPLGQRVLRVAHEDATIWAWFGGREPLDPAGLSKLVREEVPQGTALALGEPAQGIHGWRLTHRQARAALPIALRNPQTFLRYGDVAILTSILQDDLLATSLCQLYLAPLSRGRDGGRVLRQTLRAYFTTDRNTSSAAAALQVSRQTVINRLHTIEERLGRPVSSCASEVETALRLEDLGYSLQPRVASSGT